ncbi:MAG: SUMF1/EgtB/PvdO family nonheme iron enzyme [Bacteroidales bacterium]|nr:SUMF1/EgtB/PvdO family nonheme iron enzyme [Bacteroidales bacterium]
MSAWLTANAVSCAAVLPGDGGTDIRHNSTGDKTEIRNMPQMTEIPEGIFMMGSANASGENYDEAPRHEVVITKAFRMSVHEITNIQYEEFCPSHKALRGDGGFSSGDNEAVVNVTWEDADAYCRWLSVNTGKTYRLPTEAEWEYACRAGTSTEYYTGASLPAAMQKHQSTERNLVHVSLEVGLGEPNGFGLHDMHGNVEEWCLDWYAAYPAGRQLDPAGPGSGIYRVTRGGSHNTPVRYLRCANRSAAVPGDRHTQIGFRIVESSTQLNFHETKEETPRNMRDVSQEKYWDAADTYGSVAAAFWEEPIPFVIEPQDGTPFYSHNHQPAITWCDNGDLLAIWFSTSEESGREMNVLGARLRKGASEWEEASLFFKVPDRNMTGSSLCHLTDGTLLHMNGVANSGDWQNLALCARRSTDNGATWSTPVLVEPVHAKRHQVISGPIILDDGTIVQLCDAGAEGDCGSAIHLSTDNGITWDDQWDGSSATYTNGGTGTTIAGIHAGIVQLKDGSLMAFGRGNSINGKMPVSRSTDKGKTWKYSASGFPAIGSGQRLVFLRLNEGVLMLASFGTNGLFVTISEDEGQTWSSPKLMTDGKTRHLDGGAHTGTFVMSSDQAEPKGYFACTQTPDGTIHLISSRLHYRFNLGWIKAQ